MEARMEQLVADTNAGMDVEDDSDSEQFVSDLNAEM
jgi:hypothetical protein